MSNIQQHEENSKRSCDAPLARFLHKGSIDDTTKPRESKTSDESSNGTERSTRSEKRGNHAHANYASYSYKPKHHKRPRKSKHTRPNPKSNENNALPRVDGYCRCGAPAQTPYFERCENCFAEDSERWNGRDQSAIIPW